MTKVPTSYFVMSSDRQALKDYVQNGGDVSQLPGRVDSKKNFLFTSYNNPNFIRFSASYGKYASNKVKVSFIDPKDEFFSRYVESQLKSTDYLSKFSAVVPTVTAGDLGFGGPADEYAFDPVEQAFLDDIQSSISKINEENRAKFARENSVSATAESVTGAGVQNEDGVFDLPETGVAAPTIKTPEQSRKLYISFGVGQDMKYWTGPIQMTLVEISIDYNRGKVLDCTFTASNNLDSQNKNKGDSLLGREVFISGKSKKININNIVDTKSRGVVYSPYISETSVTKKAKSFVKKRYEALEEEDGNEEYLKILQTTGIDFHYLIVDCIKNFLQKTYRTKNVIVLLPDLSVLARSSIERNFAFAYLDNPPKPKVLIGSMQFAAANLANIGLFLSKKRAKLEQALSRFVTDLGFTLVSIDKTKSDLATGRSKITPIGVVNSLKGYERARNASDRLNEYYTNNEFYCNYTATENDKEPNGKEEIKKIVTGINEGCDIQAIKDPVIQFEDNINILDVFSSFSTRTSSEDKKRKQYPLIPSDFDPDEPALIFGHSNLINKYLYGKDDDIEGVPLHPGDLALLSNDKFIGAMRTARKASINQSGFVDTLYPSPDELALEIHKEDVSGFNTNLDPSGPYREEERIEIFKFNTKSPNVTRIDVTQNLQGILAGINSAVGKQITRRESIVADGILPPGYASFEQETTAQETRREIVKQKINEYSGEQKKLDALANKKLRELFERKPEVAKDFVKWKFGKRSSIAKNYEGQDIEGLAEDFYFKRDLVGPSFLRAKRGELGREFVDILNFTEEEQEEFATIAKNVLLVKNMEKFAESAPIVKIPQYMKETPASVISDIVSSLVGKIFNLKITTLPFFHLFGPKDQGKECYLFAADTPVVGSSLDSRSDVNTFISGMYTVQGVRHTIDAQGNAFSEFNIFPKK